MPISLLQIANTEISNNRAITLADLEGEVGNDAVLRKVTQPTKDTIGRDANSAEEFLDRCGEGGGGGICFVLSEGPRRASAEVIVQDSSIAENSALNGGEFLKDNPNDSALRVNVDW